MAVPQKDGYFTLPLENALLSGVNKTHWQSNKSVFWLV